MLILLANVRYAWAQLRRNPGFTLTAVVTLALGIGAATAVFSVINGVLLRPLPYRNPERIVVPATISRSGYTQPPSYLGYQDMRAQNHTFEALAGYSSFSEINLESPRGPVALQAVKTTDNFFAVFGVRPILGRTFLPGEDKPGRDAVAVLSYEVWRNNFAGQPSVIGNTVQLDGSPYTIIGVLPGGFRFPLGVHHEIYTPLHADPRWASNRGSHWLQTIGLLKPGIVPRQAQLDMDNVLANMGRAYPDTDAGRRVKIHRLDSEMDEAAAPQLWTLSAAVLALLVISCVNVGGLLLARGVKREREMAMRAAIGASRSRLMWQLLTESLMLAFLGLAGGIALANLLLMLMRVFLETAMARGSEVRIDHVVLLVACAISAITSVLAGLLPALRLSHTNPVTVLKTGGSAGTARTHARLRSGFVVVQVALTLVLLATSGLLIDALARSRKTDFGFQPAKILETEISLSPARYQRRDLFTSFYEPLLDRVSRLPGVNDAGIIDVLPIQSWGRNSDVHIKGQPPYPPQQEMLAETRVVSTGYFGAMGIRLLRGRLLTPALDTSRKSPSIVVNQAFVKKFFSAGQDPIGQHIDDGDATIVGVVGNVRQAVDMAPMAEMNYLDSEIPPEYQSLLVSTHLVIATTGAPDGIVPPLREVVHQVDPTLPFRTPQTMNEIITDALIEQRMDSWLFGTFATFALLLSVVGLYGLISHEVEQGTRDIGVRMALGATRVRILERVLSRTTILLLIGLCAGGFLSLLAKRLVASIASVSLQRDVVILLAMAAAFLVVGLAAAFVPACRAALTNPMQALRNE